MLSINKQHTINVLQKTNNINTRSSESLINPSLDIKNNKNILFTFKFAVLSASKKIINKMASVEKLLDKMNLRSSAPQSQLTQIFSELKHIHVANHMASMTVTPNTLEEHISNKKELVKITEKHLERIKKQILTDRVKTNYKHQQLMASLLKMKLKDGDDDSFNYADFWDTIANGIDTIKTDYIDVYSNLMEQYTEMYRLYNSTIQQAAGDMVKAGADGNTVKIDPSIFKRALDKFKSEVKILQAKLGTVPGWNSMTSDSQKQFMQTLAPAFKVDSNTGQISFDLAQIDNMSDTPCGQSSAGDVPLATYNAWLAGFNPVGASLQSNMQAFGQRYSQANSTYDNLVKVLSSSILAMGDSARDFIKNFN